ncbi:MAG: Swt1 family HEPN domain-containing protein [Cyanobacteria bacterium J06639_18]
MALSNRERVGRALDLLKDGLYPFVERELRDIHGDKWVLAAAAYVSEDRTLRRKTEQILKQDVGQLLHVVWSLWRDVFKNILGNFEKNLVGELKVTRNAWAHNEPFSTDDTHRALDSIARLLSSICALEADEVEKQKQELLRVRYAEQARRESQRVARQPLEGTPTGGLKPWREIVTPHPDIASGRYQEAEFAADLWQVYLDQGSDEYRIPTEFFSRTYLTEGLKQLLTNALRRLSGNSGDPVIELQTNFGGGKTHAMLALYHLFMGVPVSKLPGLEPVLEEAKLEPPVEVNTAVLVGNKISPGQPQRKSDGTIVRTLWGELAWQLGGREAYEMLRETDETSTNPGDTLRLLFNRYAPCLILIDEWVAYARQLHDQNDLPGGSFDTHFTFAQTLSESAKNANQTLLVVSIPASDNEIGGDRGKEALSRLKNAIGRVESPWRPANAEESFEIVRRRLFQPITEQDDFVARDAVVRGFGQMYQNQSQEFPSECREALYKRRLEAAYPIHPELFDRLYEDWSTLDKFQRTRGVLRLMAKVIHSLWEAQDKSLLIMPASISIDDGRVREELTRYLEDNWVPVIEKDVDGVNSLPLACDRNNPNLGRYSACRRVARTIYLGSAPTLRATNRGLEDLRIKLGCVQPGESVSTFGDALRRLTDQATHLYIDNTRYWFSTQPSVTRLAQDRAEQIQQDTDKVWEEIIRRLRTDRQRGEFTGVHIAPSSTADIPDEASVRLVVLRPEFTHKAKETNSKALSQAEEILNNKGASPRYCKNMLLFLAPDQTKLELLERNVCQYLAWNSILQDKESLNLDVFQSKQATTKQQQTDKDVKNLIQETYIWLLVPEQPDTVGVVEWLSIRLQKHDSPILQASRKAINEEHLITNYSSVRLRLEALDPYLWSNVNHIDLKKLWEYLANYLYLPRLKNDQVLLQAVQEGISNLLLEENFAYATSWDEAKGRYLGLKTAQQINNITLSSQSLIIKPEIAQLQFTADAQAARANIPSSKVAKVATGTGEYHIQKPDHAKNTVTQDGVGKSSGDTVEANQISPPLHFHGDVKVDPLRLQRDVGQIADEIVQHFTSLVGSEVEITLDIQVKVPDGIPENVIRTVTENCIVLKFKSQEFE